jgi:hypothetical protein
LGDLSEALERFDAGKPIREVVKASTFRTAQFRACQT